MLSPHKLFKRSSSTCPNKYQDTRDRISELPDELLELILKNLTLRDAVRTSVLSYRWKNVWSLRSNLFLDKHNMLEPPESEISKWRLCREKFVRVVNQLLDSYQAFGKHLATFSVTFRIGRENTEDIDEWIGFAIRMGTVKDLSLNFCRSKDSLPFGPRTYVLRQEVLGVEKINLKKLCLTRCQLGQNLFTSQLSGLETLLLDCIPLIQYDLRSMFSCLINLKILKFYRCTLPKKLYLGSLHLLKSFSVSRCFRLEYIKLSNVNLSTLDVSSSLMFIGYLNGVPKFKRSSSQPIKFNLNGVPNLETFYYRHVSGEKIRSFFGYDRPNLPVFKTLVMSTYSTWRKLYIPESLRTFGSVTELKFYLYQNTKFDFSKMISILNAFPSLQKLNLYMFCTEDWKQTRVKLDINVHQSLEYVELGGFHDTPMQIKFAIYLLNHATSLKRLIIKPETKIQPWNESKRRKVFEELAKFSKNSQLIVQ